MQLNTCKPTEMLNKRKAKEENESHRKKYGKYNASYIKFGFTSQYRNRKECPQCVICNKLLENESMLPNKLNRHLSSAHPSLVEKPKEYFLRKLENLTNPKALFFPYWTEHSYGV